MKRGEIWEIDCDSKSGTTSPVILISVDSLAALPVRIIIPVSEWKDRYEVAPWMVQLIPDELNHLKTAACADALQVRLVSTQRLLGQVGIISEGKIKEIESALSEVMGIQK